MNNVGSKITGGLRDVRLESDPFGSQVIVRNTVQARKQLKPRALLCINQISGFQLGLLYLKLEPEFSSTSSPYLTGLERTARISNSSPTVQATLGVISCLISERQPIDLTDGIGIHA